MYLFETPRYVRHTLPLQVTACPTAMVEVFQTLAGRSARLSNDHLIISWWPPCWKYRSTQKRGMSGAYLYTQKRLPRLTLKKGWIGWILHCILTQLWGLLGLIGSQGSAPPRAISMTDGLETAEAYFSWVQFLFAFGDNLHICWDKNYCMIGYMETGFKTVVLYFWATSGCQLGNSRCPKPDQQVR